MKDIHDIITAYLVAGAPILSAIAWPIAVAVVIFMLRRPIRDALANVNEASWGSAKVKFAHAGEGVADTLSDGELIPVDSLPPTTRDIDVVPPPLRFLFAEKAKVNPLQAILEGYSAIESWFDNVLTRRGIDVSPGGVKMSALDMTYLSVEQGWLPKAIIPTIQGLSLMRDLAVKRGGSRTTVEEAEEYLTLIDGVRYTLATQFKSDH